ncbi:hypothetical protein ABPG75_000272 [Micractinium tetrahymenae]
MIACPGAGAQVRAASRGLACSAQCRRPDARSQRAVAADAPPVRTGAAGMAGCCQQRSGGSGAARRRSARAAAASSSSSSLVGSGSADYAALQGKKVYSAATGAEVELASLWRAQPGTRCVVVFLTHFADLSSTELAQKLLAVLPELSAAGVGLLAVGLGEPDKARRFAELLQFPVDDLYADPTGELYTALGFSPGFAPDASISAYAKLLPMLAGIGSPGTIQEVLRGYTGDRAAQPVFSGPSNLFDVLGRGYQRPLELATLRLFNMNLVLSHWNKLAPANERLLTQQGGCLVFEGQRTVFRHADTGILKYVDVGAMLRAALPSGAPAQPPATQVTRTLL